MLIEVIEGEIIIAGNFLTEGSFLVMAIDPLSISSISISDALRATVFPFLNWLKGIVLVMRPSASRSLYSISFMFLDLAPFMSGNPVLLSSPLSSSDKKD